MLYAIALLLSTHPNLFALARLPPKLPFNLSHPLLVVARYRFLGIKMLVFAFLRGG
jgi:hypothetical protein